MRFSGRLVRVSFFNPSSASNQLTQDRDPVERHLFIPRMTDIFSKGEELLLTNNLHIRSLQALLWQVYKMISSRKSTKNSETDDNAMQI